MESYESMTSGKWTVYSNPFSSAGVLWAFAVMVMLVAQKIDPALPWQVCGVSMLFFAIYNQVMGLFLRRWPLYMGLSYLAFIAYVALLVTMAGLIAEAPLSELPNLKKIFALLSVFYVMLTILAAVYRTGLYLISTAPRR